MARPRMGGEAGEAGKRAGRARPSPPTDAAPPAAPAATREAPGPAPASGRPPLTDGDVGAVDAGLALDPLEYGGHAVLLVQEAVEALSHGRRHGEAPDCCSLS